MFFSLRGSGSTPADPVPANIGQCIRRQEQKIKQRKTLAGSIFPSSSPSSSPFSSASSSSSSSSSLSSSSASASTTQSSIAFNHQPVHQHIVSFLLDTREDSLTAKRVCDASFLSFYC
ncbi:hypothetical protein HZH68_015180 [Vespula germanica]|uniref:Uncharacterized protein n=1 Tax=Vespula germanica TaxID=30212 RepID=A0A834J7E1_VESGE|nr:hypothetical protein HZH68_015180 [Vespula germanica]